MPNTYWVEALMMATHIFNILPSSSINNHIPFTTLFQKPATYDHLRVFGCLCYPNLLPVTSHKLAARSTACVFLGYPSNHKGYRCLDLTSRKVIISRHVIFDESNFPFSTNIQESPSVTLENSFSPPTSPFLCPLQSPQPNLPSAIPTEPVQPNSPPAIPTEPVQPNSPEPVNTTAPQAAAPPPLPETGHPMMTRSKRGIIKPKQPLSLHTEILSPLPSSHLKALEDPNWTAVMNEEYDAQIKKGTWDLVPRPQNTNIVRSMWLFRHKFGADGKLSRYKARLVANGKSQEFGLDYDETFSPVVKPATIRLVLELSLSRNWPIRQLDVKNAFLHGTLEETVYMHQPPGFRDQARPDHVCLLKRSLYGLKQSPRAWNQRFAQYVSKIGFVQSKADPSLFVYHRGKDTAYLLLYVDDIGLTASSTPLLHAITTSLSKEFEMTDLGDIHYFLGISIKRNSSGMFLNQRNYAADILHRANMTHCNTCTTPAESRSKLAADVGPSVTDPTLYRSLAGALQYLTFTRPDISFAVQQVCLYMHDPREPHFNALKRILRYIKGTLDYGLQLYPTNASGLIAYSDADWAGCPTTRRSTSGYCIFHGNNLISWSSKRQHTVSRSSAEAEYRGVANAVAETTWLRNLLLELHSPVSQATLVYCDNISAVYLSTNPVQHQRTKHVEIDLRFVRERIALGQVRVLHVPSSHQYADIFTKGLPTPLFTEFRSSLNILRNDAKTDGG